MKRSEINAACQRALACFIRNGWNLPPIPQWDVTDFGLGDFAQAGLVLINLAAEPEYCEKLMYAVRGQITPLHTHKKKKEDIICRTGRLALELWPVLPSSCPPGREFSARCNGAPRSLRAGETLVLEAGERITLTPGLYHAFWPESAECVIGEVSTANDDEHDNFFVDPRIGRYPEIEEDQPAAVRLVSDR